MAYQGNSPLVVIGSQTVFGNIERCVKYWNQTVVIGSQTVFGNI